MFLNTLAAIPHLLGYFFRIVIEQEALGERKGQEEENDRME